MGAWKKHRTYTGLWKDLLFLVRAPLFVVFSSVLLSPVRRGRHFAQLAQGSGARGRVLHRVELDAPEEEPGYC